MSQRNPTQEEINLYAEYYVLHGDKSKAFRNAFPNSKAKADVINNLAVKFHKLPQVSHRVSELAKQTQDKAEDRFDMNAEWLLGRLKQIDDLDILEILSPDFKSFKPLNEWPKVWRTSISGIDIVTLSKGDDDIDALVKKIKWPDKTKNLELIGRHIDVQAFKDKVEHSGSIDQMSDEAIDQRIRELSK